MTIHGDKVRWLFWLRWRILQRSFSRRSGRAGSVIGTTILLLFWVIIGGLFAVGSFFAYRFAPAPINIGALFLALTAIYFVWIVAPIMQIATNEGLDVAKLSLFPLTRAELMISLLLSTLLDGSTIAIVLLFLAVIVGWAVSLPLLLLTTLTMFIFYIQVIGMSQLIIALLSHMLQNRRLRDLSVIIIVIFSASGYLSQFAFRNKSFVGALKSGSLATYLQWLPPGMAARAIQQASIGNWSASFGWLVALASFSALVLYIWQLVVEHALASPETGGFQRARRRQRVTHSIDTALPASLAPAESGRRFIAPQVLTIADKEVKYFRRDPQLARLALLPLVYVIVLVFSTIYNASTPGYAVPSGGDFGAILGSIRVMFAPSFLLFSLYSLAYNSLGFERQALTTLFLFPVDPKYILFGKNLVVFVLGLIELVVIVLLVSFFTHIWTFVLPALAFGLAGIAVILACGNVTSVFLPQRLRLTQRGFQATGASMSAQGGCLRIVMSLTAMLVAAIILLPAGAALLLPVIFHVLWVWIIAIPFALAYGAAIYFRVTTLIAPYLVARTPEILALVASE